MSLNERTPNLAAILPNAWQPRDAVHIAVIPAEAGQDLQPGSPVTIVGGVAMASHPLSAAGVVSPFLTFPVRKGECFWLMLPPGTITSLRHEWTSPAFPSGAASNATFEEKAESEAWLADFIGESHYKREISNLLTAGTCTIHGREMQNEWVPNEFWHHLERLTGRQTAEIRSTAYFDCRC